MKNKETILTPTLLEKRLYIKGILGIKDPDAEDENEPDAKLDPPLGRKNAVIDPRYLTISYKMKEKRDLDYQTIIELEFCPCIQYNKGPDAWILRIDLWNVQVPKKD